MDIKDQVEKIVHSLVEEQDKNKFLDLMFELRKLIGTVNQDPIQRAIARKAFIEMDIGNMIKKGIIKSGDRVYTFKDTPMDIFLIHLTLYNQGDSKDTEIMGSKLSEIEIALAQELKLRRDQQDKAKT